MKYKIVIFDVDNTISESRTPIDLEMAVLFERLMSVSFVGVISGATYIQMKSQVVSPLLSSQADLSRLYLMPLSGNELYEYKNATWARAYSNMFSGEKKAKIFSALKDVLGLSKEDISRLADDRGSQITFSALGKDAPKDAKSAWDPDRKKRTDMISKLRPHLSGVHMAIGGTTSIDFTEEGVDKASGVESCLAYLGLTIKDALFIGDALFPGGNDSAVLRTHVDVKPTHGPEDTKRIIKSLLQV